MSLFKPKTTPESNTFWEHLEVLRWTIIRILAVLVVLVIILFGFKDFLFTEIIFRPLSSDFIIYRGLCKLALMLNSPNFCPEDFNIQLINIDISGQFISHISASFTIALVLSVPYLLYEIWRFIAPALYPNERKSVGLVFLASSFLFYLGAVVSYYLIFPLTIRFLGTYQISALVPNQISVQSYLSTLYILVFSMGLMFEMPVLAYFLSRLGIISRQTLRAARSYALVVILILAAVITPTTDPFTMLVVAFPLYLLYEVSIWVCKPKIDE
ncbi:MAG: twin-arginine translocase subunit TatC [Bacteroidales bacterium]|nr:twin-arginine translocase subunit TatC [Bacteroidales bacterium]